MDLRFTDPRASDTTPTQGPVTIDFYPLSGWRKSHHPAASSNLLPLAVQILREHSQLPCLDETERSTLNTINVLGGQVTASSLAATEGIRPSAAANRLVKLDREGYLVRRPRGRREGDLYVEPRSATSTPMVFEEPYEVSENSTGSGKPVGSTAPVANRP